MAANSVGLAETANWPFSGSKNETLSRHIRHNQNGDPQMTKLICAALALALALSFPSSLAAREGDSSPSFAGSRMIHTLDVMHVEGWGTQQCNATQ